MLNSQRIFRYTDDVLNLFNLSREIKSRDFHVKNSSGRYWYTNNFADNQNVNKIERNPREGEKHIFHCEIIVKVSAGDTSQHFASTDRISFELGKMIWSFIMKVIELKTKVNL